MRYTLHGSEDWLVVILLGRGGTATDPLRNVIKQETYCRGRGMCEMEISMSFPIILPLGTDLKGRFFLPADTRFIGMGAQGAREAFYDWALARRSVALSQELRPGRVRGSRSHFYLGVNLSTFVLKITF